MRITKIGTHFILDLSKGCNFSWDYFQTKSSDSIWPFFQCDFCDNVFFNFYVKSFFSFFANRACLFCKSWRGSNFGNWPFFVKTLIPSSTPSSNASILDINSWWLLSLEFLFISHFLIVFLSSNASILEKFACHVVLNIVHERLWCIFMIFNYVVQHRESLR